MKTRFLFYLDWREQMNMMTDEQVRRFINNLCKYTEGIEPDLPSDIEKALWIGILPSLKINEQKYEKRIERNRENGRLGGAPLGNQNANKIKTTQNNPNNLINDNREEINDNRKMISDNCKEIIDNREEASDKSKMLTDNRKEITGNCEEINNKSELVSNNREVTIENSKPANDYSDSSILEEIESLKNKNNESLKQVYYAKMKIINSCKQGEYLFGLVCKKDFENIKNNLKPEELIRIQPFIDEYLQAKESSYQINQELERKQNEIQGLSTEGIE